MYSQLLQYPVVLPNLDFCMHNLDLVNFLVSIFFHSFPMLNLPCGSYELYCYGPSNNSCIFWVTVIEVSIFWEKLFLRFSWGSMLRVSFTVAAILISDKTQNHTFGKAPSKEHHSSVCCPWFSDFRWEEF